MKRLFGALALVLAAGCTPGGIPTSAGGGAASVVIDVNLTNHGQSGSTPGGPGRGYAPLVTTVAVGTTLRFTNSDGFTHTATSIPGSVFPPNPFNIGAETQTGHNLSGGWSSV